MTRTVLITGAGGFVGSHMAEGFLAMGNTVIALDRAFDAPTAARLQGARLVENDLTRAALAPVGKADLVIHAAAITTPPLEFGLGDADYVKANVAMLLDCLDFAVQSGAGDFVFLSSSGVFSLEDGEGIHLESTRPTASIPYALAKRAGEDATGAANGGNLRAISVRLGPVYGPNETPRATRTVVSQVRRWLDLTSAGQPIVVRTPEERRDWTFAPDLPRALDALLRGDPALTGVVHLTSANIVSNLDLARAVAGLVAGSAVVVEPSGERARLPMRSDRVDCESLFAWTPLAGGLAQVFAAEGVR